LLPGLGLGINGVLLEGASGTGKSELIAAAVEAKGINKIDPTSQKADGDKQVYYKIDASMPLLQKVDIIIKAFEDGDVIWIDELNGCIDDGLEKALNAVLTGQHPRDTSAIVKPGFTLFASANSLNKEGRSIISPALRHRLAQPNIKELKEYPVADLETIITHWVDCHRALRNGLKKVQDIRAVILDMANDFNHLLQKPENDNINLRMLRGCLLDEKFLFEYLSNGKIQDVVQTYEANQAKEKEVRVKLLTKNILHVVQAGEVNYLDKDGLLSITIPQIDGVKNRHALAVTIQEIINDNDSENHKNNNCQIVQILQKIKYY
jgi:hypothetical protein